VYFVPLLHLKKSGIREEKFAFVVISTPRGGTAACTPTLVRAALSLRRLSSK
jgi:hypothetical protein